MSELKLVRIYVQKKYIVPMRIVFFLASIPFFLDAIFICLSGNTSHGNYVEADGGGMSFVLSLGEKLAFAMLFVWLATGALREKKE